MLVFVVAIEISVVVVVNVVMLRGKWFEQPLELLYIYLFSLPLTASVFDWPPDVLSHNLLNFGHLCFSYMPIPSLPSPGYEDLELF